MIEEPKTPGRTASFIAAAALLLFLISNVAWAVAYSALSRKTVGVYGSSPTPTPTVTAKASPSASPAVKGIISGRVGYPSSSVPAQTICAVSTTDASQKICLDHAAGAASTYSMTVPAGTYNVYASLKSTQGDFTPDYKAYYNKYVTCGMSASCPAPLHSQYIEVTVPAGASVNDVNPLDWYANS